MEENKTALDLANEHIGWIIRDEALELGYKEFFSKHVCTWIGKGEHDNVRDFAKEMTHSLPDYCSFDAFYAMFEDRFTAWYETGNVDGIKED